MLRPAIPGDMVSRATIANIEAKRTTRPPINSRRMPSQKLQLTLGYRNWLFSSTRCSIILMNRSWALYALIVVKPFRVSPKCEKIGDLLVESSLFSLLHDATYTLYLFKLYLKYG